MNLRPLKLYCIYWEPLNSSNVGDFSWSWIYKQARIHTGFHRFTKIGQIFHK